MKKEIKPRLKELRQDTDTTIKKISNILGVNENTYPHWENNYSDMKVIYCNKLANYYHVSIDYLLGLSDNHKLIKEERSINTEDIGNRLRKIRKELNYTEQYVAEKVGIAQTSYSDYENNTTIPTTFKLLAIAQFYNISMDYILGRTNSPKIDTKNSRINN